jgi:hypothetical protein
VRRPPAASRTPPPATAPPSREAADGGTEVATTVLPFILRGVSLLGIDSVQTPIAVRRAIWARIASDLRPTWLGVTDGPWQQELVGLDALPAQLDRILAGGMRGRVLVDPTA